MKPPGRPRQRRTVRPRRHSDRVSRNVAGYTLIALAFGAAMVNTSDIISDLKDWHGIGQPSIVGPLMKQLGVTLIAAIGGKLLPSP